MKYLLDTHLVIWTVTDTNKISKVIQEIIQNPTNEIFVSTISFWEISLKYSIGKLNLDTYIPEDFPKACHQMGFDFLNLSEEISSTYHQLTATYHKDPFDRMLVWQAIKNDFTLISHDENVKKYLTEGLKVIW